MVTANTKTCPIFWTKIEISAPHTRSWQYACARYNEQLFRGEQMLAERTQSVPALERGLAILEHLTKCRNGQTLSQLTRHAAAEELRSLSAADI